MKLVAEYLEQAAQFARLADSEANAQVRQQLQGQADAYYRLAVKQAREQNLPSPRRPPPSRDAKI